MPQPTSTRTGVGRGAQRTGLRGIDLFNAAQQRAMADKHAERNLAIRTKVAKPPQALLPLPPPSTIAGSCLPATSRHGGGSTATALLAIQGRLSGVRHNAMQKGLKKETPSEYAARHAAKAAAAAEKARLAETRALQRERAKKLRAVTKEFYKRCREENLCLNCGWPGHVKRNCPDPPYVPVW